MKLTKKSFYILSFSWGIVLTLAGLAAAGVLLLTGHKARRYGWTWYFELGENWGGCELGMIFIKCRNGGTELCDHEFGHAIQNCIYGPFMPLVICLPSSLRYWFRRILKLFGRQPKKPYYSVWFEAKASEIGRRYMKEIAAAQSGGHEISAV